MDQRAKRLAFESSTNAVRFLLNRTDLEKWERSSIEMAILELEELTERYGPAGSAEEPGNGTD